MEQPGKWKVGGGGIVHVIATRISRTTDYHTKPQGLNELTCNYNSVHFLHRQKRLLVQFNAVSCDVKNDGSENFTEALVLKGG